MPLLLLEDMDQALRRTPAPVVFISNPGKELSTAAANLTLNQKLDIMEQRIGKRIIDAVVGRAARGRLGCEGQSDYSRTA